MNGEQQQNHHQSNGHSSSSSSSHNGYHEQNGYNGAVSLAAQPKVASVEMCIFCFDTLHAELHNGSIGYTPRFTNEP